MLVCSPKQRGDDMFANAKPVKAKKAKPEKAHYMFDGFKKYDVVSYLINRLTEIKKELDVSLKGRAKAIFLDLAKETDKAPPNFVGVDGSHTASVQMRKRGVNSPLTDDEVALLEKFDIPYATVSDVEEMFVINPEHANNSALLKKVEKALKGIKDLPEDFILRQESKSRRVVTEETMNAVFEKKLGRTFFDTIATLAIQSTTKDVTISTGDMVEICEELMEW